MTTSVEKPKKQIPVITAEYRTFWQPLFDNMGLSNPKFGAKLCYMGIEFSNDGTRVPCVRFFPNELNSGQDYYLELFDWNQNYYDPQHRTLYRLKFNPNWSLETSKYVEVLSDKLPTSTYTVKLSDFDLVNRTDARALTPEISSKPAFLGNAIDNDDATGLFNMEEELSELFVDKDDNHYSSMTIRDLYCMLQNVPMSNKKWLNQLISKGKQWQQQK